MTTATLEPITESATTEAPAPVMTEREAMLILIDAAKELALLKYGQYARFAEYVPDERMPLAARRGLAHRAQLLEAAHIAQGLSWWQR